MLVHRRLFVVVLVHLEVRPHVRVLRAVVGDIVAVERGVGVGVEVVERLEGPIKRRQWFGRDMNARTGVERE